MAKAKAKAKARKERKKEKMVEIPVFAQGIITPQDLVEDSFEDKIGKFSEDQQKKLRGLRRTLKNRVIVTF